MRRGERCDKPLSSSSSASSIIIRFHEYSMSYSSERRRKKVENDANIVDLTFTVNLFPHMARFGPSAFHIWFLPCHSRPPQISPWTLKSPFVSEGESESEKKKKHGVTSEYDPAQSILFIFSHPDDNPSPPSTSTTTTTSNIHFRWGRQSSLEYRGAGSHLMQLHAPMIRPTEHLDTPPR